MHETTFFKRVAQHNLERFHSEVLAWIFEQFPDATKKLISTLPVTLPKGDLEIIHVEAESKQTDILIYFSIDKIQYCVYIENKIKASEHFIGELSQTDYYYHRVEKKESSLFIFLKPSKIDLQKFHDGIALTNLHFQLIKAHYNPEQLNEWTSASDNPWLTLNYNDIYQVIKPVIEQSEDSIDQHLALGYLSYINDFPSYLDPFSLSSEGPNLFGQFESYKFLHACILHHLKLHSGEHQYKSYYLANSANGSEPLVAFYIELDTPVEFDLFTNRNNSKLNVGVQLQGTLVKFYISAAHEEYQNTALRNIEAKSKYQQLCKSLLEEITRINTVEFKQGKNFNKNTTKTFFSRSFDLKIFMSSNAYNTIEVSEILSKYILQINSEEIILHMNKIALAI